ncbi:kinase-like domain-containing protein [Mycena haematopus]|nr:kinase-like domain-containing protein [Mycena haematopus]
MEDACTEDPPGNLKYPPAPSWHRESFCLTGCDRTLTGAVEQLEMTMMSRRAPDIRPLVASFNLPQLQARATEAMNKKCVGAHLLAVGGYNIVFLLPFDDQTDIVARLRIPGGGSMGNGIGMTPQDLSARFVSEAATLRFVKTQTSIPVPELYHWDADEANPVGAPYMLMERVSGVFLPRAYKITTAGLTKLVTQIANFEAEVYYHPLNSIGCLVDADGTVGPLVRPCTYGLVPNDRGPFKSSKQYLLACVGSELDEVRATKKWIAQRTKISSFNGGVDALSADYAERWFQLLHQAITTLPDELPSCPDVFRLVHTDFQSGNLLVSSAEDPTIVAVLDWEGAQVLPAWDARSGCNISRLLDEMDDAVDKDRLDELYLDITSEGGRILGQSPLRWARLMWILESLPSLTMDKDRLNKSFREWFAEVEEIGKESCRFEFEAFRPLMTFITNSCV